MCRLQAASALSKPETLILVMQGTCLSDVVVVVYVTRWQVYTLLSPACQPPLFDVLDSVNRCMEGWDVVCEVLDAC